MRFLIAVFFLTAILLSFTLKNHGVFERKDRLSEYGFFIGELKDLTPSSDVIPYDVNTPLFSNYADKLRFIKLPDNSDQIHYNDSVSLGFPVGTVLIKNFLYPDDFRNPQKGRKIIETRLLVNQPNGWQAYPYIWTDDQKDAVYDPAGETKSVSYVNLAGKKVTSSYAIPNKNQCKGCHIRGNKLLPIGTTARQLNRDFQFHNETQNQLSYLRNIGRLDSLPTHVPKLAMWNDPGTGTLNERSRAYLDANCGHCHSKSGPASTSGLFLDINETNPTHLGINKTPVAAGRGAGDLQYDIKPGDPQHSILIFRMKTNDPAIAMPEIGREQVHEEGVALIEEWIRKNAFNAR